MEYVAFDTETTGLNPWLGAKIFAFSTCDEDENYEVWRLDGKDGNDPEIGRRQLQKLIWQAERGEVCLIMANAKFDIRMTEHLLGYRFAEKIQFHDVLIQAHMLMNNHPNLRLKDLAWEFAGIPKDDEAAIKPYYRGTDDKGDETIDYSRVPPHLMHEYQERDVERTMLLHLFLWQKIRRNRTWKKLYGWEMDLIRTTLRMEERGIMLNREHCTHLSQKLATDAEQILDDCEEQMGRRINLGNDGKVRELLFQDLEFPIIKTTKTGLASVDKDTLRELKIRYDHPVLDMVLKYRSWTKGSKMFEGYIGFADADDAVHPDIRTCGAGTGRETCRKPNLQNVAKSKSYLNPFPVPAREAFRPRPGFVNFHLDYSGIEFRMAVILTGDEQLLQLVRDGTDLHVKGAELLIPELWEEAEDEDARGILRGSVKNANFAKMYGAGMDKVGATVGVPVTREDFKRYDSVFGALDSSAKKIVRFARNHGYVETIHGRRLWVPADKIYAATNYKIQGGAAEFLKIAQVRVHGYLEKETRGEAKLLLPIHDEVVLEWPRTLLADARHHLRKIRELMIDFPMLAAPLDVDVEVATIDWAHKKSFSILED